MMHLGMNYQDNQNIKLNGMVNIYIKQIHTIQVVKYVVIADIRIKDLNIKIVLV